MHTPVKEPYWISSGFGNRLNPSTGKYAFHEGVDIPVAVGTPVYAPLAGKVYARGGSAARVPGTPGFYLILSHSATLRTRYNHLDELPALRVGQSVREGQIVARSGNTGGSTGPHLHFAVYKLINGLWTPINPVPWLTTGTPTTPSKDDDMLAIYEGPDSNAAKKWVDLRTGKAVRTVTKAEMRAVRSQRAEFNTLIVTLDAKEWKAFLEA